MSKRLVVRITDSQAKWIAEALSAENTTTSMLGGRIWVKSQEGEGSTFYFTIPYTAG